jgi:hypothetical protein
MRCNVLCNGPSRISYKENNLPSIGCNIPWSSVNYTVIFGNDVIDIVDEDMNLIPQSTKLIVSNITLEYLKQKNLLIKFKNKIYSVYNYDLNHRYSVGHVAVLTMISMGFKNIDVYGCDNYFDDLLCTDSYTRKWKITTKNLKKFHNEAELINRGKKWKEEWSYILKKYNKINIKFIK